MREELPVFGCGPHLSFVAVENSGERRNHRKTRLVGRTVRWPTRQIGLVPMMPN